MAKIYFLCGFAGSGKTTYARQLASSAFRFSIDEWMISLYGEHMDRALFDARLAALQEMFKASALQLLKLDVPVIFDFGFWSRVERVRIIGWAMDNDIDYEMHYMDVGFEECCRRALKRNSDRDGKSYKMTREMLAELWTRFEVPDGESVVVVKC